MHSQTNLLACTPSTASLIAAFAPVSPALYSGTLPLTGCNPGRVIPIIPIHGLADKIVPFNGRTADKHGNTSCKFLQNDYERNVG
jgi:poly(3-hydroxybutyrate) depolymerase